MQKKIGITIVLAFALLSYCYAQSDLIGYGTPPSKKGGLGVGYGFPYGGLGLAADVYFLDNMAFTLAVGTLGYTAGYEIGAKYLLGSSQKTWRPEAILLYGVNGVIVADGTAIGDIREAYLGLTAGAGSQFMFGKSKKHGFDAGVTYVISSGMYKRIKELEDLSVYLETSSRFGFYLGYRFAFDFKI